MFEAMLALCLTQEPDICTQVLLPGYEAADAAGCAALLSSTPPDLAVFAGLSASAPPSCAPTQSALSFDEVAPGVFVHRGAIAEPEVINLGDVSNFGFIIGERSVAVIDSGATRAMGEAIWRAIRARTDLPVSHVVLTHMHPDHVLGAAPLAEAGAQVVGDGGLNRALADRAANYLESLSTLLSPTVMAATRAVAVELEVTDILHLDLGNRPLELRAWPSAHTGTDITVLDQATNILFAGDLVFDTHAPALDGSLRGWQAVMQTLSQMQIAGVVPGHGGPLVAWPAGATPMTRYLDTLAADTKAALDAGERMGQAVEHVAESEAAHWSLFEAYNPRNATVAFTELEWE